MIYIENEGALFKGVARGLPDEVWSQKDKCWKPYKGSVPKPVDWGDVISEVEAREIMDQPAASTSSQAAE